MGISTGFMQCPLASVFPDVCYIEGYFPNFASDHDYMESSVMRRTRCSTLYISQEVLAPYVYLLLR